MILCALRGLEAGWLRLDQETKEQLLLLGSDEAWLSSEDLAQKEHRDAEQNIQQSSLQAERLLGAGIQYRAVRDLQCFKSPSSEDDNKVITEGHALVGYPSYHHWIRLADSESNTDFISHWVFQDPGSPALEASWCRVKVSQNSFGVLHLSWPGLVVSQHSTVYYCLEWSKRGAEHAKGSGMTSRPAPCLLLI